MTQHKGVSIRTRMTLWSVTILALVLVVMSVVLCYTLQVNLQSSIDRELEMRGKVVERWVASMNADVLQFLPPPPILKEMNAPQNEISAEFKFRPRVFDLHGKSLIQGSRDIPFDAVALKAARVTAQYSFVERNGEPLRVYTKPLQRNGKVFAVMQTAYSLSEVNRDLQGLTRTLWTLIPMALLIVGAGAAFLTSRILRPVSRITHTAAQITSEGLSQRLPVSGNDELSRLAATFNAMLARLEQSFEQQKRFTADASHELRTPLAAIKLYTSQALHGEKTPAEYRRSLEGADRAATMMNRIIQDLLLLARSDAHQLALEMRPVAMRPLLQSIAENLTRGDLAAIHIEGEHELIAAGDEHHLMRLFTNLVENALHHTPPSGKITLLCTAEDDEIVIAVRDTGSGIASGHLPHLCERFYRVDEARARKHGGTGLGLAICRSIVEAHGGKLEIASTLDVGTTVTVRLPKFAD